jgi:energy-coupling factor transporter transmembrane protein EcfT
MAKKNFILSLHPNTKLVFTFFVMISVLVIPSFWYGYAIFPVCFLIALGAKVHKEFLSFAIKALLFLLILVFLIQVFFIPGGTVLHTFGFLSVHEEGIVVGLNMTSRILGIASAFLLFFRITEIKDLVRALENMGLPSTASFVVLSTLQIIPEMKKQTNVIMDAQKTRGVETEGNIITRAKAFLPTLSPLILSSLAATEERAVTLEARAFSVKGKKTRLHELVKTGADITLQVIMGFLVIGVIIWRILL